MASDTIPDRPGAIDSVLFVGFGGPTAPSEVMPFLRRVVEGRGVPDERLMEVAHHYEVVGGRSPYNELTELQASAVRDWLSAAGSPLPVYVGMRTWHPFLAETIDRMNREGRRHAAGVILAPHRSEASSGRYIDEVRRASRDAGGGPHMSYIEPWFDAPGYFSACAERIEQASGLRRGAWPGEVPLIFTAHSIPVRIAQASSYVADLTVSCRGVASLLGVTAWRLAYQSRSGDPSVPWLSPDVLDVLRECAAAGASRVVLHAIGFLTDHVEVLYDLDVEASLLAGELGMRLTRAPCVSSHPDFVAMLGGKILDLVRRTP